MSGASLRIKEASRFRACTKKISEAITKTIRVYTVSSEKFFILRRNRDDRAKSMMFLWRLTGLGIGPHDCCGGSREGSGREMFHCAGMVLERRMEVRHGRMAGVAGFGEQAQVGQL